MISDRNTQDLVAERHPPRPAFPHKLYGRELDIGILLAAFERTSSGHGEALLLPGSSGVGKTALVQELRSPIRNNNGFFIKGKFEQYQQNIPYFAFRQALAELCRELQSGDAQQRSRFKADILQAVGNLGQVLVDLVPEFGAFLGAQAPLDNISPQEARHRFAGVLRNLLKVICRPEHPLVLFLDDWQWSDAASCELLKQIDVGISLHYLLVVASYRDDEVSSSHPLMSAVDAMRAQGVPVGLLHVTNIVTLEVQKMVSDAQKPATEDLEGLVALIYGKTLGNPFFVRSFFSFLHDVNWIWFDEVRSVWRWRVDAAGGRELPGNAVELFVLKLRRLDADSQDLISWAACLGNRFDVETLSMISGRDRGKCLELLSSDQARDMLMPLEDGGGNARCEELGAPKVFAFLHDRIQQAAYTLIEPAERAGHLLRIGRLLLASLHPGQLAERLFEVVNDLNAGRQLMRDPDEQMTLVKLNITAGRRAYAATAYGSALQFYRVACALQASPGLAERLGPDGRELRLQLFKERAECAFLEGHHPEAAECVQQAVAYAETAIEKAAALNVLIVHYTLRARYREAIAVGRQALAILGVSLPEDGYEEACQAEIREVRRELGSRSVSSLIDLPVMGNPTMLLAAKLLITMGPPCYRSDQRLWGVIVPKVVNLTLRYGNIPQVGYSHTAFGGLLGWVDHDYATAKEFGELATALMTQTFRSPSDQSVFYLMIGSSLRHWFKHLRYGTQDYTDAYESGLRSGNLQYAAYAFGHNMYCRFYQGVPLASLMQETRRSLAFSRTRSNQWAIDLLEGGLQIFGTLSGADSALHGDDAWSELLFLRRVEDHRNIQVTCIYKVLKACSLLVLGDCESALGLSDEAEPLIYTVGTQGLLPWPEHVFARLLILTALYARAEGERQTRWRAEIHAMMGMLRIWADNGPENFEHKYLLAAAEVARIDGRLMEAMQLYDRAVEAAQAGDFLQWEGIANERAHSFWRERGNERLAHVYWQQAYVCYSRWGAGGKVRSMEAAYRAVLAESILAGAGNGQPTEKMDREVKGVLLETQIKQLRNHALQVAQATQRTAAASQAEELARAMQRVRVEIADRKRTEEMLRQTQAILQAAMDQSTAGIAIADAPGGELRYVNDAGLLMRGGTRQTVIDGIGLNQYVASWQLLDLDGRPLTTEEVPLSRAILFGETCSREFVIRRAADDDRIVLARAAPICDESGHVVAGIVVFLDITDSKRTEEARELALEQLHDAQKLAAIGTLARGMAHEINNPIMGIMNYAQLIKDRAGANACLVEFADEIIAESQRVATMTHSLLGFTQQQDAQPFVPVTLTEIVAAALPAVAGAAQALGISLTCAIPVDLPPVSCIRSRMDQVISALLRNAVEACEVMTSGAGRLGSEDMRIRISAERIDAGALKLGRTEEGSGTAGPSLHVRLTVEDNGHGLPAGVLERVCDPFFTTKDRTRHSGLGLWISRSMVQEHGGVMTIESEAGQGTKVHVDLPVANL